MANADPASVNKMTGDACNGHTPHEFALSSYTDRADAVESTRLESTTNRISKGTHLDSHSEWENFLLLPLIRRSRRCAQRSQEAEGTSAHRCGFWKADTGVGTGK